VPAPAAEGQPPAARPPPGRDARRLHSVARTRTAAGGLLLRRLGCYSADCPGRRLTNTPAGPPADRPTSVLPALAEREEDGTLALRVHASGKVKARSSPVPCVAPGPSPLEKTSGCQASAQAWLIKRNVQSSTHERGPWQIKRFQLPVHAGMHATGRGQQSSARVGRRTNHNPRPTLKSKSVVQTPAKQCSSAVECQRAGCGRSERGASRSRGHDSHTTSTCS
jgi:hypothetical protein